MYLTAILVFYLLVKWRIKKDEYKNFQFSFFNDKIFKNLVFDFIIFAAVGMLIGGRLGYVIFYDFSYFFHNPLEIIIPGTDGISGMSYHGGLIGVIIASIIFTRKNKLPFWAWADFIVPAIPAAYFFGRIGNFLNGELYGRATNFWIGMYFPLDDLWILRHPSQLYEAFFEGIILFFILWILRNKSKFPGYLLCLYLLGYGFVRFIIEFFRQPDSQIGLFFDFLTLGQIFSVIMIIFSFILYKNRISKAI